MCIALFVISRELCVLQSCVCVCVCLVSLSIISMFNLVWQPSGLTCIGVHSCVLSARMANGRHARQAWSPLVPWTRSSLWAQWCASHGCTHRRPCRRPSSEGDDEEEGHEEGHEGHEGRDGGEGHEGREGGEGHEGGHREAGNEEDGEGSVSKMEETLLEPLVNLHRCKTSTFYANYKQPGEGGEVSHSVARAPLRGK